MSKEFDFESDINLYDSDSYTWSHCKNKDVIPMWVADMNFKVAPVIVEAIQKRMQTEIYCYSMPTEEVVQAVVNYQKNQHALNLNPESIVFFPGVVAALVASCIAFTEPDEEVVIFSPYYPPFMAAPKSVNRKVTVVEASYNQGGWYLDFERLEQAITNKSKYLIVANPYNPVGRVLTVDELNHVCDLCEKHNLILCSDEIHSDLILDPKLKHHATLALRPESAEYTITMTSISKAYNTAGLSAGYAIIPNPKLRNKFQKLAWSMLGLVNPFGLVATAAAYNLGEPWRQELIKVLSANAKYVYDSLNNYAGIKTWPVQATYLAWLDVRELKLENPAAFFEDNGVKLHDGVNFGMPGFLRLNFACSKNMLEEGINRIRLSVNSL